MLFNLMTHLHLGDERDEASVYGLASSFGISRPQ
jgi:hypothetical protein